MKDYDIFLAALCIFSIRRFSGNFLGRSGVFAKNAARKVSPPVRPAQVTKPRSMFRQISLRNVAATSSPETPSGEITARCYCHMGAWLNRTKPHARNTLRLVEPADICHAPPDSKHCKCPTRQTKRYCGVMRHPRDSCDPW